MTRASSPASAPATTSTAERHGWRVNVQTPHGIEAYGVLVGAHDDAWRARVLTYPNVLWVEPGGKASLKFVGRTPAEAEQQAVAFVLDHCRRRGFEILTEVVRAGADAVPAEGAVVGAQPARRKVRFVPIRYGIVRPSELSETGNLSETGLFILSEAPLATGSGLAMTLHVAGALLDLRGCVVWSLAEHRLGRVPGMGIQLARPPGPYVDYVRQLP